MRVDGAADPALRASRVCISAAGEVSSLPMRFEDSCFPIVVCVREGGFDSRELAQLASGFEPYFARGEPYAVLNVSRIDAAPLDARARMLLAAWANEPRVRRFSRQLCAGTATVVARPWERHALTAIQWLWTPVSPHRGVRTVAEGITYCIDRLTERGIALPAPPLAFAAELRRLVRGFSVAGLVQHAEQPAFGAGLLSQQRGASDFRLKKLFDSDGTITLGWIAESVLWARFSGHLSGSLSEQYVAELERRLVGARRIRFFVDASALSSFDLLGRTAALRVLLTNRQRLASVCMLNWRGGTSPLGHSIASAMGGSMQAVTQRPIFEALLQQQAPLAGLRIQPWHALAGAPRAGGLPREGAGS
jgi:hypothetical protein